MSRFRRDLNQRGDDLIPGRFQMLFCLTRRKLDATITSQVSISLTINSPRERKEEREETRDETKIGELGERNLDRR